MTLKHSEWRTWALWGLGWLIAVGLVIWSRRLPAAEPTNISQERFSAQRALPVLAHLTRDIGYRQNGTPEHARAAAYLANELAQLDCVEVELQHPRGVQQFAQKKIPWPPFVYRTTNVVARIAGHSPEAILLNAHYDTSSDSVGAGDDAMAVAAMLETA